MVKPSMHQTWSMAGGTYNTASVDNTIYSQSFSKYTDNLDFEVTKYVTDWLSGSIDNNGFILIIPFTTRRFISREKDWINI